MDAVCRAILAHVKDSGARVTPAALETWCHRCLGIRRSAARKALRILVEAEVLTYTYQHGCSFVEISFDRPVRIGRHIVLLPAGKHFTPAAGDAVVRLGHGAAFGSGRHPSTRLALEGVEYFMRVFSRGAALTPETCLDIGTGSGVLALAALRLGVGRATGLDIDPCSRFEAAANARLNGLEKRFVISRLAPETIDAAFDIVLANLRPPTLKKLLPAICRCLKQPGAVVLSGFREESEARDVVHSYGRRAMSCIWRKSEKGWQAAVLFRKRPPARLQTGSFEHR